MNGIADAVLALNQENVPHVGALDSRQLLHLLEWSAFQHFEWADGELAGFIVGLLPGMPYESKNYRWFNEEFPELAWFEENETGFLYIDRLAVAQDFRRSGTGSLLYEKAREFCREHALNRICCEVNLEPPNVASHAFHQGLGFQEVATLKHAPGKVVSMYVWELE